MTRVQECLAKNIKKYRTLQNMTQEKLAEKAKTSTNYIGVIETGKKFPSPQMLEKIAKALKIDSLLLFQNDEKNSGVQIKVENKIDVKKLKKRLLKNIATAVNKSFK